MKLKIEGKDISQTIIELEFAAKFNTLLIQYIITRQSSTTLFKRKDMDKFRDQAINAVNDKYGKKMLILKK